MANNEKLYAAGGIAIGGLFVYSAVKNKSVLSAVQATVKGQSPKTAAKLPVATTSPPISGSNLVNQTAVVPSGAGETAFFTAVLGSIAAPPTKANLQSMAAWAGKESQWPGGPNKGGTYNPLNTTQNMPGATNYNSIGVKNYGNPATGVAATAATLLNGNYNDIVSALRSGQGLCGRSYASLSTWSGGGYSSVC